LNCLHARRLKGDRGTGIIFPEARSPYAAVSRKNSSLSADASVIADLVRSLALSCYYNRFWPGSMHSFTDLQALDEYLAELDAAAAVSDDRLRAMFDSFEWSREPTPEKDPYSAGYKEWQMRLYSALAGVTHYDTENERSHFDVDHAVSRPFPYLTGSPSTVGDHLMGLGFMIKTAGIGPGARVLEFGPGWGNTTLAFAQLGCHVTAVDIEPNFVDLVNRRVRAAGLEVEAIRGDFNLFYDSDRQFDAVVFFESFHHCSDHLLLLHSLRNRVPADGVVVFAAEPIVESFPVPWGVRLDGMSVWSIRKHRWMELGFQESYFVRTMMRLGWVLTKHVTTASSIGTIFLARPFQGTYQMGDFLLPPDEDASWAINETDPTVKVRFAGRQSRLTLDDNPIWASVEVDLVNGAPFALDLELDSGLEKIRRRLGASESLSMTLALPAAPRTLILRSGIWCPAKAGVNKDERRLGACIRKIVMHPQKTA
jgi:SAM-dependent methyltransferase